MKMINFLIKYKKKRVNKKLYMIQIDYLKLGAKKKRKIRNSILKIDDNYREYLDNNTLFSESDYVLFEKKLKKLTSKIFA